ncbi:hypothetical protein AKJ41_05530 [candidate division MSBL1 archaeon SCGC-AAA259O05]|uniref:Tc1-like transposase DDE domain-containing protein n=1 Tax=candidate division MSBL1 archaeon SCGC-AAA259O05 TaxID=1698271 RepID=A0A133UYY6_9EURY|nr:hypothetical protein AKJ41_05530 [candidate division MSBL1 archaeon SCGC-AAA259O05]
MPAKMIIEVEKHLSIRKLESRIREEKDSRMLRRLFFLRNMYEGDDMKEATAKVGVSLTSGYRWLHRWNEGGLERLKPDFGGGRPPKLSDEEREELKEILAERSDWTTKEIKKLVKEKFGVEYSRCHLRRILKSMGMNCGKPYQKDYRRPENAEEKLKERLDKALENINSALEEEERVIIGFLDESRPKTTSNTVRVWAFEDPEKKRNTTKYQANTFGFYPLNGESVVEFKENSKKERVCEFFERIRKENPEEKIVMILDNFSSHRAKAAREKAEELGIELVFLPPYSPDLNPIEQIWRGIKREISTAFFETKEEFLELIKDSFEKLSAKLSYASGWISKFLPSNFQKICI